MSSWEDNIRKVVPYVPGEQPNQKNMIKLNTNENPYPPSQNVTKMLKEIDTEKFRLYPDPTSTELVQTLADYYQIDKKQVFVGVGSDDVLALSFLTFFQSQKPILFPDITYSFYDVWADLYRIPYKCPKLNEDFKIDPSDYFIQNGGIIFPNPNAPTGVYLELSEIRKILDKNKDVIVIIDEAYIDFGGDSALPLIEEYENLLIVQTFSKSRSLAGMRIGFAMGNEKLIKYLNDVKYSFNSYTMNQASILLGAEAVKDEHYFRETIQKIIHTREWTTNKLKELGFQILESKTNFLFVTHKNKDAEEILFQLREKGIFVRHFKQERINNFLRITIGTQKEMEIVVSILKNILEG